MFALAGHYIRSQGLYFTSGGKLSYCEFGTFDGLSLSIAYQAFGTILPNLEFVAFDTFSGIASSSPGEASFPDGDWAANIASFRFNMELAGPPSNRLKICPGNIVDVLADVPAAIKKHNLIRCAIAHIDCDVYEPAKSSLNLLKYIMPGGGIILFDDYDTMDASDEVGERRAAKEFLAENAGITLEPYYNYGLHGRSFLLKRNRKP
jgi:hypothetical protein